MINLVGRFETLHDPQFTALQRYEGIFERLIQELQLFSNRMRDTAAERELVKIARRLRTSGSRSTTNE